MARLRLDILLHQVHRVRGSLEHLLLVLGHVHSYDVRDAVFANYTRQRQEHIVAHVMVTLKNDFAQCVLFKPLI